MLGQILPQRPHLKLVLVHSWVLPPCLHHKYGLDAATACLSNTGPPSRPNRILFPNAEFDGGISRLARASEGATKGTLQSLARSANGRYPASADGRRRVRSVDEAQHSHSTGLRDLPRRVISGGRAGGSLRIGGSSAGVSTDASTDRSSTAFSDEYDLSHEGYLRMSSVH
ncbi:hypothetical protein PHLGIDRAFT_273820 [Phlebiopsis gigantea 11061_1 CR5-6]|uniref:Uncharacterized protein n=1 Tax=Phlebiopsis gigantea (strain 11061_1 CR5-6) TaxID=745531 RepID=A0A0C3PS29_PHLG1|nr:hypothetical protein PHLGIDRAFT_273820 [Phlebiopsis gigantea 11061_1 CR5-6]